VSSTNSGTGVTKGVLTPTRIGAGVIGGLVGGVAFGILMQITDMIPMVAMLVDSDATAVGWLVHLAIAAFIGATFAGLFGRCASSVGASTVIGAGYGIVWWVLGALILMPARLGMDLFMVNTMAWQSLLGHVMSRTDVHRLLLADARIAARITAILGEGLVDLKRRLSDTVFKTVSQRIATTLAMLAGPQRRYGVRTRATVVTLTHEQIAALVGTTRKTATRVLDDFADRGLIRLGRGRITLLDMAASEPKPAINRSPMTRGGVSPRHPTWDRGAQPQARRPGVARARS
jgi:hypothetical protein